MTAEIRPDELARELERGAPLQLLDVRLAERAAQGHIEAADYRNLPVSELGRLGDPARTGLARERPVVVVCDRGISSRQVTAWLRQSGYDARSMAEGMLGWSRVLVPREARGVSALDRLVQIDRVGKGALGYLALRGGEALAVDPGRDLDPWLAAIAAANATVVAVVDTHCHADYLSGGPALAAELGVPYRLHPADAVDPFEGRPARFDYAPLADGETLRLGDAAFTVEHTPGHTEGSVALRLGDELALTGDLLFVASVGRPDLADRTEAWTEQLWRSLERVRRSWSPATRIFPAHYLLESERGGDRVVEARLGDLAPRNPPFAIADPASFRSWIATRAGAYPDAYRWIKLANLGLAEVDDEMAGELEAGKSQCALSG
jgi:glyoxylase-like metal-dependent hydrolase (beta-lactamase superfamily II)